MKSHNLISFIIPGLLFAGAVQAETASQDIPTALSITGKISSASESCRVTLSQESLYFTMNADEVIYQGNDATQPQIVTITIKDGDVNHSTCSQAVLDGHIAVKFVGEADNADGTALANEYALQNDAATGVGIGFFKEDHSPVAVNKDVLKVNTVGPVTNEGTLKFGVQPVRLTNQTITGGRISASATVEIERL
ncbi:hypothetical protein BN136_2594 [Cronobacter universalis NCTC 9529]|uniref:Fimbrial protein SthA n=1 Tax=Cronobacter universalis NCTC 9529 TaxID=1074000 RepID=A0AAC8VTI8_9ENTR|nr:fimbrial protein [Cronobacter universalis]ALB56756.1 hypothetical protein AFK65_19545 [Cronobacter universalis NCTC 9529]CCK16584.1 hypothetical protein BN136_2594 [Cronobacter universalis NCTC 9529]STD17004.1 putative fimbrial protein SthA [Cronobacter universalis NCTC 9529]